MKRMRNMGRCAPLFRSMSNSGGNAAVAHWFPPLFERSCSGAALGESKQGSALQEEGDNRGRKKEMQREEKEYGGQRQLVSGRVSLSWGRWLYSPGAPSGEHRGGDPAHAAVQ